MSLVVEFLRGHADWLRGHDMTVNAAGVNDAIAHIEKLEAQRAELLEIADAAVRALASDICNLVPDEDLQRWQATLAEIKGVLGDD